MIAPAIAIHTPKKALGHGNLDEEEERRESELHVRWTKGALCELTVL